MSLLRAHHYIVKNHLRRHQRLWLKEMLLNSKFFMLGSRGLGKTHVAGYLSILLAAGIEDPVLGISIPADNVYVTSKDRDTGTDLVNAVRTHVRALELAERITHDDLGSQHIFHLKNGKKIHAFAGKPESWQGFHGHSIIDELAANPNDEEELIGQSISVTSAAPHRKNIILTNADEEGTWLDMFWNSTDPAWAERRDAWKRVTMTIHDAYPEGLPPHILEAKAAMSPMTWRRWFLCEFVSGTTQALLDEDVYGTRTAHLPHDFDGLTFLSIDPGYTDNPAGIVVARAGSNYVDVEIGDHWFNVPHEEQMKRIHLMVERFMPWRILCDQGTVGFHMCNDLEKRYGDKMVVRMSASTSKRQRRWETLQQTIKTKRLRIAQGSQALLDDLGRLAVDENDIIVLPKRRSKDGNNVIHCDAADALLQVMEYVEGGGSDGGVEVITSAVADTPWFGGSAGGSPFGR